MPNNIKAIQIQLNKRNSKTVLVIITGITFFFLYQLKDVQFKYDFELFYPKADANTAFFNEFRKRFKSDKDFILIGIENKEGVFKPDFLEKVDSLSRQLEGLDNVMAVSSPTNAKEFKLLPLYPGIYSKKIVRIGQEEHYAADSLKLIKDPNYRGSIISADGKAICLVVLQKDSLSQQAAFQIADDLKAAIERFHFDQYHISGKSMGLSIYVHLIRDEVQLFAVLSVLLILLFLFIAYRSFWGLWMPTLVVLISVIWTVGLMALTSKPIDIISNIIPTMLLVIGISDVIHLLSRFLDHLREGFEKPIALKIAIKEVGLATFITSLTTAIGFLSLTTSNVQPVIDMGIYTTIGLAFCFLLSYSLFPALLILNGQLDKGKLTAEDNFWQPKLSRIYDFLNQHKKSVVFGWAILTLVFVFAASQLRVNSFLLDGLSEDHPQRKAFNFFEKNFSGFRPFELSIQLKRGDDVLDFQNARALDSIQTYLSSIYGVGNILSPISMLKNLNRTIHAGDVAYYQLPTEEKAYNRLLKKWKSYRLQMQSDHYLDEESNTLRIQGRMRDDGSLVLKEKNEQFHAFMKSSFKGRFEAVLTGAPVMMDNTHAYIVSNVFRGLIGAIVLIGILMGFLFKSWKMVLVTLLTNIVPLLITAGIMAINGVEMRLSTSIIFIIAFGIAVDDSIHFLSKFRHELAAGKTIEEALKTTFTTTGKAMVVTTLILSGGFLTLAFSEFLGTHYIGVYISLTLFIALLADLMILPTALRLLLKDR